MRKSPLRVGSAAWASSVTVVAIRSPRASFAEGAEPESKPRPARPFAVGARGSCLLCTYLSVLYRCHNAASAPTRSALCDTTRRRTMLAAHSCVTGGTEMAASETLRVGIVGAGDNTRKFHIPRLQAIPGVEIVSVVNRSRASSERVAQQFGIPKVYDTWKELVEAPDTNAIVIGTWPYLHCPVTLAALKHVLTEARMAMNAAEARQMLAAARAHPELTCMIVPSPFSLGVDATIQRHIAEGYLGEVVAIELHGNAGTFADFTAPLHWRQNRDLSGENVLTLGIWYEAVLRWVGEATRVMARTKTVVRQRRDEATGELRTVTIPDHVEIIADMACGAVAHFSFSAVTGLARPPEVWLYGTEGTLYWQQGSATLAGGRRGATALAEILVPPEERGGWRVEEEFVNAVRGLEPVRRTTFEDGVRYMEFTEAVARSAATGQAIALPLRD